MLNGTQICIKTIFLIICHIEELLEKYKTRVENELKGKCEEVLKLLADHLLPAYKGKNNESEVFYLKMSADYYRYLAEFSNENQENGKKAQEHYQNAMDVAEETLNETHPTRLGLALNFSVCYYEILKQKMHVTWQKKHLMEQLVN